MGRSSILFMRQKSESSRFGRTIGSLVLSAKAMFRPVTHSRKWRRGWLKVRACYGYDDYDPVIQLNPERIEAHSFGDFDPSTRSSEGTLWKKNIIMGGKCQLPDFSGVIIYDTQGNVVPPAKTLPALTWK
ncbi:OLC1v1017599C1 [Oldenlandia corymbosa var. corymbosa]|uniref:OLC1v1017599C1 n=1 Tax=Oldenlandia corymbosa var. corymbosa TaxID=529605 RepID=A0AAV1E9W3_OLDCO|nr:OLC1v1017599C1 [Oldenlandia corymbosa var. corymbosa]